MRSLVTAMILTAFCAGAVSAGADEPIPPEDWRAMTTGKTLHYYKDGELFGREYYRNEKDEVVFRFPNGLCAEGVWTYDSDEYCFAYEGQTSCFRHVKRGDDIVVISGENGEEQVVHKIAEREPLSCAAAIDS